MDHKIVQRKSDHIELSLKPESQFDRQSTGFENYWFVHQALPEISLNRVDLSLKVLGKHLKAPILIAPMTGGMAKGEMINRNLAITAQRMGLGMGVGSQRITFEKPEVLDTFQIRQHAPDILLLSNLGAVQLNEGFTVQACIQLVEEIEADGLYFHLNPLQEAIQSEGDHNFSGLLEKIAAVCQQVSFPVLVKECGCGISEEVARQLKAAGVSGVDVSGAGGTSWALIESQRAGNERHRKLGQTFANWGIPTTLSIQMCRRMGNDFLVIGSGGIRTGLDAAKAIALGADMVSMAYPLLAAALQSPEAVMEFLEVFLMELRLAMFCVGAKNLAALKETPIYPRGTMSIHQ